MCILVPDFIDMVIVELVPLVGVNFFASHAVNDFLELSIKLNYN